ncbi:MAG: GNAT family N-acetyltransferase [Pseudomonadota bacterium]
MVELSNSADAYLDNALADQPGVTGMKVISSRCDALALLADVPRDWVHSGYQSPRLLSAWLEHAEANPFVLQFETIHGPVILPLEEWDDCTARYVGGKHANGNFPLGSPNAISAMGRFGHRQFTQAVRAQRQSTCSLVLERQLRDVDGLANPFVYDNSPDSPNVALSFSIRDGFDAVLQARNGKRLQKKMRSSQRKLEELGVISVQTPDTPHGVNAALERFFDLKSRRFRDLGIFDVFAEEQTRAVFRALFSDALSNHAEPSHVLHTLCIDDNPVAVIGCTEFGDRVTVEFGAFDDALATASPGDLLFFRAIELYCERGFEVFDFGVGDELYKRRWCDIETWHADTFIAANFRGQLIASMRDIRTHTVRSIKSNERVWAQVKRLRKAIGKARGA